MDAGFKTNSRRTVKLTDHHALRSIDDKGPLRSHQRNLAHVDLFLLGALLVLVPKGDVQGSAVRLPLALTLNRRHLRLAQFVTDKIQT